MEFEQFVGLPWKDRGRTREGLDCWGLFREAFAAATLISLPSYADDYSTAADRQETDRLLAGGLGDWAEIDAREARQLDAVAMRLAGHIHIGMVVRRGRMLHLPRGKSSVIEPIARFRPVITGFYRYRDLA